MNINILEWVRVAEEDYEVAVFLTKRRGRKAPLNSICFHCQQCVEKYLKGRLEEAGLPVPKIHNLVVLLNQVLPLEPLWASFQSSLATLNNYAVHFRYPGHLANPTQTREAVKTCRSFRKEARLALGLSAK